MASSPPGPACRLGSGCPGLKRGNEVRQAAKGVEQPVFIATPADEEERAKLVFEVIPGEKKTLLIPERAVHGSSMLVAERNPGAQAIWPEVEAFLEQFLP